ncbi:MAG: glycosyltransferase family 4 protein [Candidatus Rifleibacteriota bacterium]
MKKIRILVFVHYYLPGYEHGGPVRTISNMIDHLSETFEFLVFCLDRDEFDKQSYQNIKVDQWNRVGAAKVFYCSPERLNYNFIKTFLRKVPYDLLYINSFVNIETSLFPMIMRRLGHIPLKPVILAPRGQFSSGALEVKKWKKKLFIKFFNFFNLWKYIVWQASSEFEKNDIKRVMGADSDVVTAMNLSEKSVLPFRSGKKIPGKLRIIFLSRIAPMKNLDYALKILSDIKDKEIEFNIYGPIVSNFYWKTCRQIISSLPDNVMVNYKGSVEHSKVLEIMADHDLFFLPSAGENYGHVILEAAMAGLPLLISDNTPWRDLKNEGVGWDINLEKRNHFIKAINDIYEMEPSEHYDWRKRIHEWARQKQQNQNDIDENKNLFYFALRSVTKTG